MLNDQTMEELTETNRRLNRRCQSAEHDLAVMQKRMDKAMKVFQDESFRANRYVGELRDIYFHHSKLYRWYGCWFCKLRGKIRNVLWKFWEIKPKENKK